MNACKREGILWLIIVKGSSDRRIAVDESERSLKVKSVLRGYEEEGELFRCCGILVLMLMSLAFSISTGPYQLALQRAA